MMKIEETSKTAPANRKQGEIFGVFLRQVSRIFTTFSGSTLLVVKVDYVLKKP
jgi:hypothetical protein